jgi:hypothetical protein
MAGLPTMSGREAREAFLKDGWTFARQRGSHTIRIKPSHIADSGRHRESRPASKFDTLSKIQQLPAYENHPRSSRRLGA